MRKFILRFALFLNRNNFNIKTNYTIKVKVRETNYKALKVGQELAVIYIDTRPNIVKIELSNELENEDSDSFLYAVGREIKNLSEGIKKGRVSIAYLIHNSNKAIDPITSELDGVDYRHWREAGKEYQYFELLKDENDEYMRLMMARSFS